MSGHDHTDCGSVMLRIQEFLDGEMSRADYLEVKEHLAACAPCMSEYDRDMVLKALVRRSCGCERAPARLRAQIVASITEVTMTRVDRWS